MSKTIDIDEIQAKLRDIIARLQPGDEIIIVDQHQRVAKLVREAATTNQRPGPGLCRGMIYILADDDEHLQDFAEYMP